MRSKVAKRTLNETPAETRIFVRLHADIVVRIHQLLRRKGWNQKDLANRLGKVPSEVSKWLSGNHNLTLQSIARLQAELGSEIIQVPKLNMNKRGDGFRTRSIENPIGRSNRITKVRPKGSGTTQ